MAGGDQDAQALHRAQGLSANREKKASFLAGVLILAWIVFTALAFWSLQGKYVRVFQQGLPSNTVRWFESSELQGMFEQSIRENSPGLVVHFWDSSCPCSRFSLPHIQDLIQQSTSQGVSSVVVVKASQSFWGGNELAEAKTLFSHSDWVIAAESVPELQGHLAGSPSAAVFDANKSVRYIGPYSSDAFCSTNGDGFVETVLAKLTQVKSDFYGSQALTSACFCDW